MVKAGRMGFGFQWGADKSAANEVKHGLSFLQAAQIFRGSVLIAEDQRKDYGEPRFRALGKFDETVLCVMFTRRDGDIRIISAWKAGRYEREIYEQSQTRPV